MTPNSSRIFRVVELPAEVDAASAGIKTSSGNGTLMITLPKAKRGFYNGD